MIIFDIVADDTSDYLIYKFYSDDGMVTKRPKCPTKKTNKETTTKSVGGKCYGKNTTSRRR